MAQSREAAHGRTGSWTLRAATAGDLPAARELMAASGLPIDGLEDQFTRHFVVGESDGRLIAVAGVELYGRCGLLRSVAVAPASRGSGVAAELVRDRIEWARVAGVHAMYLLTTTAEGYFTRHGFDVVPRATAPQEIRVAPEFAQACPESATLMRLALVVEI